MNQHNISNKQITTERVKKNDDSKKRTNENKQIAIGKSICILNYKHKHTHTQLVSIRCKAKHTNKHAHTRARSNTHRHHLFFCLHMQAAFR